MAKADHSADRVSERALRFGRRIAGEKLARFSDLKRQADDAGTEDIDAGEVSDIMALLHCRPAIDRELNGQRLAPLVSLITEERFDLICTADLPDLTDEPSASALPLPGEVRDHGEALLVRAGSQPELARLAQMAREIAHATPTFRGQAEAQT